MSGGSGVLAGWNSSVLVCRGSSEFRGGFMSGSLGRSEGAQWSEQRSDLHKSAENTMGKRRSRRELLGSKARLRPL